MDDLQNATSNNSSDYTPEELVQLHTMAAIDFYCRILIIVFGTIGNTLSVIIFCTTSLKNLSSSYYLTALAVSDTAFLLTVLVQELQNKGLNLLRIDFGCTMLIFVGASLTFTSVWFVVAFTVERFIAVQYPLLRPSMCTVSRAKIVIIGLTLAGIITETPLLNITYSLEENNNSVFECKHTYQPNWYKWFNILEMVLTMVIPSVAIVGVNTSICLTVHRLSQLRRRMTLNGTRRPIEQNQAVRLRRSNSSQHRVTRLLITVSTVFILLCIPNYIYRIVATFSSWRMSPFEYCVQQVTLLLYYSTFSINFLLYCLTGQNFRKSLINLLTRSSHKTQETTRVTVVSEHGPPNSTRHRTITLNGSLSEAHEMLPLAM